MAHHHQPGDARQRTTPPNTPWPQAGSSRGMHLAPPPSTDPPRVMPTAGSASHVDPSRPAAAAFSSHQHGGHHHRFLQAHGGPGSGAGGGRRGGLPVAASSGARASAGALISATSSSAAAGGGGGGGGGGGEGGGGGGGEELQGLQVIDSSEGSESDGAASRGCEFDEVPFVPTRSASDGGQQGQVGKAQNHDQDARRSTIGGREMQEALAWRQRFYALYKEMEKFHGAKEKLPVVFGSWFEEASLSAKSNRRRIQSSDTASSPRSFGELDHEIEPLKLERTAPGTIGLQVKLSESGDLVVVYVVPGGSAARNRNVAAGDIVIAIDDTRVSGMTVDEVARLIVGEAGTFVRLHLASASDKDKEWNVSLLRVQTEGGDGFYTGSDMSDDDCETYYEEDSSCTPRSSQGSLQVMKHSISDGFLDTSGRMIGRVNVNGAGDSTRSLGAFDSLEDGVDPEVSKKVIHVLREIVSTEKSYVRSIQIMIQFFLQPMLEIARGLDRPSSQMSGSSTSNASFKASPFLKSSSSSNGPRMVQKLNATAITEEQVRNIFRHIETLYKFHFHFLTELQSMMENWKGLRKSLKHVSSIIGEIAPYSQSYTDYVDNHARAMSDLEQLSTNSNELAQFLKEQTNAAFWEIHSAEARVDNVEPIAPRARAKEVLMRLRATPHLIKDRRNYMRKHRNVFLANNFITWAITCELCATREAGIALGQLLIDNKCIYRVGSKSTVFKDDKDCWLRCYADDKNVSETVPDQDAMWRETDYDDLVIEKGLRDAAIFRVLPNQARSQLRGSCKLLCFNTGDTVIKQGTDDTDEAMYIIVYGTVGVYIGNNPEAVTFMSSGRFFGEMGLLTGALRTASIKAEETCKLIQVTRTALAPLIEAMPQLAEQIAEVITMRRYQAQRRNTLAFTQQSRALEETQELSKKVQMFFGMKNQSSEMLGEVSNTVQGLLIGPVQRIPRYLLLTKELVNCTPKDWDVCRDLADTVTMLEHFTAHMNHSKVISDSAFAVYQIQTKILGMPFSIVSPTRRFIRQFLGSVTLGWPHVKEKTEREVFIFNNSIVIADLAPSNKYQYVARMDIGLWSTSKLPPNPAMIVTVHMEEVTWAFHMKTRKEAENLHDELETEIGTIRKEHDEKRAEENAAPKP